MNIERKTKSVKLIVSIFKNKNSLTAIELIDKFKTKMNKTTVYRILERLEKAEILHSFLDRNGLRRYVKNVKSINLANVAFKHSHFLCEECGASLCIPLEIKIPKTSNYTIKNSEHLLIGNCNNCL